MEILDPSVSLGPESSQENEAGISTMDRDKPSGQGEVCRARLVQYFLFLPLRLGKSTLGKPFILRIRGRDCPL